MDERSINGPVQATTGCYGRVASNKSLGIEGNILLFYIICILSVLEIVM